MNKTEIKDLDIIIPVTLDLDWPTLDSVVECILHQHIINGFTRFALASPSGGWRSVGCPPREVYEKQAKLFLDVKNAVAPYGIECGWWIVTTFKTGTSSDFSPIVKSNGEFHPFSNCPLDDNFRKYLPDRIALFAKIAKPAFIVTEDDFSIFAASGCYCDKHMSEFAKRQGKEYSREELLKIMDERTPEALEVLKSWRELMKDSIVDMAKAIRKEVDKESPEIPIGYMQSGGADQDGDVTLDVAKAMAGNRHTPFSRLYGTFYGGATTKKIPEVLYHSMYTKQHINTDFRFYHESDTFPHTRYFTSGSQMRAIMSVAYSYGFDGSTFQVQQLLDDPNEESAFGSMFSKERSRFNEVHRIAKQCELSGVQIDYDPFYNTIDMSFAYTVPLWVRSVSRFGIPYTSLPGDVAFWDVCQAKYVDDSIVMDRLSKGLFLDGDAAKALCERGYGKYIGVEIGNPVIDGNMIGYDLGAREVICDKFAHLSPGRNMPSAHMLAPNGNGKLLEMTVIDEKCEVVSEFYTFQKEFVSTAMTRFENELGGKIVVMGMTLKGNYSQSLLNYRRRNLFLYLLSWCGADYAWVKEAPDVHIIVNEAKNPTESGFYGMITLNNLCEDELNEVVLHLPESWRGLSELKILDANGEWLDFNYEKTDDGIIIHETLKHLSPMYILGI